MKKEIVVWRNYPENKPVLIRQGFYLCQDIIEALIELLALRKECQEWRDDAERLAKLFEVMDLYKISAKWEIAKKHIDEHNALVEKYKKAQKK